MDNLVGQPRKTSNIVFPLIVYIRSINFRVRTHLKQIYANKPEVQQVFFQSNSAVSRAEESANAFLKRGSAKIFRFVNGGGNGESRNGRRLR